MDLKESTYSLPLAIVTMSSTLVDQPIEQWEYVIRSVVTESAANSLDDMMHILNLSYKHLPRHLRGMLFVSRHLSRGLHDQKWCADWLMGGTTYCDEQVSWARCKGCSREQLISMNLSIGTWFNQNLITDTKYMIWCST